MPDIKRIAVIGPESSGKSELCRQLALHYKTKWVPEYAREYLTALNQAYQATDIISIYRTQFQQEMEFMKSANLFLFTDTEFLVAQVWSEHVFKHSPEYFEEMIVKHPYDLYLLTAPDLPWEYDPLRENPGKGTFFFNWYESLLKKQAYRYDIVSGEGALRFKNALAIMEKFRKSVSI